MIRAVVDTSIVVRAVLKPLGTVGPVLDFLAEQRYKFLYSEATLEEVIDVLARPRLRRLFPLQGRDPQTVVELLLLRGEAVEPRRRWTVCRDPKDDKFLDVAVEGHADAIVSGDEDLLVLHPFQGIPIVQPAGFLSMLR
ncbi:MAG TPA: putative toxin-antitoxin system toxin component, PIN family [Thermoanaerobaculia bacterium]|nr:putative toxin-antitoxin system toxin component, PIN family [Thermoanaerobaculia bacterium]